MDKTTAPGSSSGQFVNDNPSGGVVGTLIIKADLDAHQDEVYNSIIGAGITPSAASNSQLWLAIRKAIVERSKKVGEIFPMLHHQAPVEWSVANADTYFPALCLTDIATSAVVDAANWGAAAIAYLRGLLVKFKDGLTGELAAYGVTNWAIVSNIATLTFTNDADHIAALTALLEDNSAHGSYTDWRTITLASAIGDITAGTYAITNVNASSRTVSFAFTHADNSGAVTASAEFYANRIAGSTTTARVFSARGRAIHGAGDDNGYMVNSLARRGFFQGHRMAPLSGQDNFWGAPNNTAVYQAGGSGLTAKVTTGDPVTDGTNGTPRVAKDTNSPAFVTHLYLHLGSYTE
jgi:hypothetical protein